MLARILATVSCDLAAGLPRPATSPAAALLMGLVAAGGLLLPHRWSAAADSQRRIRLCLLAFVLLLLVVLGRAVQLEVTQGAAFRAEAAKPLVRRHRLRGVRGRILARDGTVLACDRETPALAVHYRWLEEPADPRWVRRMARSRLSRTDRKDPRRMAAAEAEVRF
jgi:cell division protein FtsI/penicillin-binding protein 2